MAHKKILFTLFLFVVWMISGCAKGTSQNEASADKAAQMLNTVITAKAYGENTTNIKLALDLAFNRVEEIENKMSRFKNESEVNLINNNLSSEGVSVSPDTYFVIQTALEYAHKTHGAFNPIMGNIIDLWGIGTDHAKVPSGEELNMFIADLNYNELVLNKNDSSALLVSDKAKLDLGAIAKGYAADEMKRILKDEGITSAMLNLGGNVMVIGTKPSGDSWKVGIQHPLKIDRGELAATIKVKDTSLVTSGSYERYFEQDGKRYHHIIDPSTGYPAQNGIISSTIISPLSIDADALSTSIYVLGKDKGLALVESLPNVDAIIITDDMRIYTTSGIHSDIFTVVSEDFIYEES